MQLFSRIVPFLFLGLFLVVLVLGLILFSYLLILGALVGIVLFAIAWLRDKLFARENLPQKQPPEKHGRIIEHDDK